jgi:dimethylargininase
MATPTPLSETARPTRRAHRMRIALVRDVDASLADCELSFVDRAPIDVALAQRQHAAYAATLASLGCRVVALPAVPGHPDSVFVEDTALVFDELAVATRPGAASRRGEVDSVAAALSSWRAVRAIEAPGTIDGGDVLRVGHTVYVGASARSNREAMTQLHELLSPFGYRVEPVPIRGCLHLKSAVTCIAEGTLLLQPAWVDRESFPGFTVVEVDPAEEHAANTLRIGDAVVYPDCFPRTRERIERAGVRVAAVDVSELQKAEGAVTCCSIVFEQAGAMDR